MGDLQSEDFFLSKSCVDDCSFEKTFYCLLRREESILPFMLTEVLFFDQSDFLDDNNGLLGFKIMSPRRGSLCAKKTIFHFEGSVQV